MFGYLKNISFSKRNRALREENERLRAEGKHLYHLMENLPHNVYFKDLEGRFIRINTLQAKLLGVENPGEAIGKTDFDFFTTEHAIQAKQDEDIVIRTGKPIVAKVEHIRHASGHFIYVTTSKSPILDENNKPIGIVGVTVDITDKIESERELKKAKEKAEEANKMKSAFLANMSHEIRTPMNGILGFSQLLKNAGTNREEIDKYVNHITGCGNTLLDIIENIIDISKLVSGQLSIEISACPINMIMDQIYQEFSTVKDKKINGSIKFSMHKDVLRNDFVIETDPHRLKQVLFHLLDNAFKFTMQGTITFGYNKEGENVRFYVKDTGIGIAKDKYRFIFDSFGQITDVNTVKPKGTGLGLAISSKLVALLGGNIWVESEQGQGSTFQFVLPLVEYKPERRNVKRNSTNKGIPNWNSKSILVAEDEELNWFFIQELLKESNANLYWAKNGLEALEMLDKHEIDLVLMDLKMPLLDGREAIRIIRSNNKTMPIIAQTAHAMEEEKEEVLKSGCNAYLVKPLNIENLLNTVQEYMPK